MTAISNSESGSSVRTKLNASLLKTDIIDVQAADVSGAVPAIFAAIGKTVHITGSTTITAFDTVAAGVTRWVKFTGSPLLTHSAALDLPGNANIQASPDDWAFCRSLGSGNSEIIAFLDSDAIGAALTDTILSATASGTNTYTATISPVLTAYVTGRKYAITFTNAPTGASTLNLGPSAVTLTKNGGTAIASGDWSAGATLIVEKKASSFDIIGVIGGDVIMTATQTLTNKTLTAPAISGTPDAETEMGFDATLKLQTQYGTLTGIGTIPKMLLRFTGSQTKTNDATTDQDFTTLFQIPANAIFTNKIYKLSIISKLISGVSTATITRYLKLGAIKVYTEQTWTQGDSLTNTSLLEFIIMGRDVPGASKPISCSASRASLGGSNGGVNITAQPVNVVTDTALDVIFGVAFSATGSTEIMDCQAAFFQEI